MTDTTEVEDRHALTGSRHPFLWTSLAFLGTWLALVFWHAPALDNPPYDDFSWWFHEATWLAENDYDYQKLRTEVSPSNRGGGAQVYMISALPTMLALLMQHGGEVQTNLVVLHLLTLGALSLILVLMFHMLSPRCGRMGAVATCALFASVPLVSAQSEMLGLDVPMVTFGVLAVYLALREHPLLAVLAAAAAFMMKPTGMTVTIALLGYYVFRSVGERRARTWIGLVAFSTLWAFEIWLYRMGGLAERVQTAAEDLFAPSAGDALIIAPDLVVVTLLAGIAFLVILGIDLTKRYSARERAQKPVRVLVRKTVDEYGPFFLAWLIVVGVILAVFGYVKFVVPRYLLLAVPFLFLMVGWLLFSQPRWRGPGLAVAVVWIALNLFNYDGRLFPSLVAGDFSRDGAAYERSCEYRGDLQAMIEAVHTIQQKYPDVPIVAPLPFIHYLGLPMAGYVEKPLQGYAVNIHDGEHFQPAPRIMVDRPRELLFITLDSKLATSLSLVTMPEPSSPEEMVYTDTRTSPLRVVYKRLPADEEAYDRWCLENLWYREPGGDRNYVPLTLRAQLLVKFGRADLAKRLLHHRLREHPQDHETRYELASLLSNTGSGHAAALHCRKILADQPNSIPAKLLLARYSLAQQRWNEACHLAEEIIAVDDSQAPAWRVRAVAQLSRGDRGAAEKSFRQLEQLSPESAEVQYFLGMIAAQSEEYETAQQYLELALATDPTLVDAHRQLSAVLEAQGQHQAAHHHRELAAQLASPHPTEVAN